MFLRSVWVEGSMVIIKEKNQKMEKQEPGGHVSRRMGRGQEKDGLQEIKGGNV